MRLHKFTLLVALFAAFAGSSTLAEETMKMNISIGRNSHYGVAVDTFANEVESAPAGATESRTSTPARSGPSANRSRRRSSAHWT